MMTFEPPDTSPGNWPEQARLDPLSPAGQRLRAQLPELASALVHAVTRYDRRRYGKHGYNPNALALYLRGVDRVLCDIEEGFALPAALSRNFNDRLLATVQKAVGCFKR